MDLFLTDSLHMICELVQHIPNFYILKGAVNIPATFLDLFVASRHFLTPILYLLMADSLKCSFKRLNLIIVLSTLKATLILPWQQTNWPLACCFTLCIALMAKTCYSILTQKPDFMSKLLI